MIRSLVGIEQQHTFAAAVTISWEGSLGPWMWEGGQPEGSLHLNCHSNRKIVGVSGCTALAQVSEPKCSCFLACLHLPQLSHAVLDDGPYSTGPCSLSEYLRKLGALEAYEASHRGLLLVHHIILGERDHGKATMALGFIRCEKHERFILRFLCCLREHFHFSTPALLFFIYFFLFHWNNVTRN